MLWEVGREGHLLYPWGQRAESQTDAFLKDLEAKGSRAQEGKHHFEEEGKKSVRCIITSSK